MLPFKTFLIREEKINYNHTNQQWQVRGDDEHHTFKSEHPKVVIKHAEPHVDHDAHESGKKVYAYLKGKVVDKHPDLSKHHARTVKFNRGNIDHPFSHEDDNSPVNKADYVVFHKNKVTAYYKK